MVLLWKQALVVLTLLLVPVSTVAKRKKNHSADNSNSQDPADDPHRFLPPGPNDKRSPCPAINVLANHGYIARDGVSIDIDDLAAALSMVFPVSDDFPYQPLGGAQAAGLMDAGDATKLTLDRLFEPKKQEHDASLTRVDSYFGVDKAMHVDMGLMDQLLRSDGKSFLDQHNLKEYQAARVRESLHHNPEASFSDDDIQAMAQQMTRVLAFGQDPAYRFVEKYIVEAILQDERLPDGYMLYDRFEPVSFRPGTKSAAVRDMFMANIRQAIDTHDDDKEDMCAGTTGMAARLCKSRPGVYQMMYKRMGQN